MTKRAWWRLDEPEDDDRAASEDFSDFDDRDDLGITSEDLDEDDPDEDEADLEAAQFFQVKP